MPDVKKLALNLGNAAAQTYTFAVANVNDAGGIMTAASIQPVDAIPAANVAASATVVTVKNFSFDPATLTASAGTTVTWLFEDGAARNAVAADKSFASPNFESGQTFTHTFSIAGRHPYLCTLHQYMTGEIIVIQSGKRPIRAGQMDESRASPPMQRTRYMPEDPHPDRSWIPQLAPLPPEETGPACPAAALLARVGRGDETAFAKLYDLVIGRVLGLARRVVRDPAIAEEVAQEAMTEVWRSAARFHPAKGTGTAWILTITHRRAVDRVRSEQAHINTTQRLREQADIPYDEVSERVGARMESQQIRKCLAGLTELQHQAITLAYYRGLSYPQVAALLGAGLPTIKSRMRDGLIRLRDCLGVEVTR